jgi:aconitase B
MPETWRRPTLVAHQGSRGLGYTGQTMRVNSSEVQALISTFTAQLMDVVTAQTGRRIQVIVAAALGSGASSTIATAGKVRGAGVRPVSQPHRLSDKATAARKLQGRYIGALRSLRPAARARVKKMASKAGVAAAVKLALTLK